jgi:hypothetical protein
MEDVPDPVPALTWAEVWGYVWSNVFRVIAGIGIMLIVYLIWWLLGRFDKLAGLPASSRAADRTKKKRHWHCRGLTLGVASFTHILIALLKAATLVGALVMIVYIFGNTIPTWLSVPTFVAFAGFGFTSWIAYYAAGISNKLHSASFIGRRVSVNVGYAKYTGQVISMESCVLLQEPDTKRIHTIPHTSWSNAVITIEDAADIDVTTFNI